MDKAILDNTRQNALLDRIRNTFIEGDPAATLCVEFYDDQEEDLPPRLSALEDDLRAQKSRLSLPHRNRPRAAIPPLEPPRGRARSFDGDERGREIHSLCRRHRRRAGKTQRIHRTLSRRSQNA